MDIAHLKTFLEIYQIRHFGKAAERLCITQSAASARIKLLEERLGVSLFSRNRNAIEPTVAGHRFHKYAEMVVNGWDRARLIVALPEQYTRSISIGCTPDSWHLFLASQIDVISQHFPDTALNLNIYPGQGIQEHLLNGTVDVGFVFDPVTAPALRTQEVISLDIGLFTNYADTGVDEALAQDYVLVNWGASFEHEHSQAFVEGISASVRTNSGLMALDLLRTGKRAAYLPLFLAKQDTLGVALFPVADAPVFHCKLYVVFRSDAEEITAITEMVALVSEGLKAAALG